MIITQTEVLRGDDYAPLPEHTQYEIAEGVLVTLRRTTPELRRAAAEYLKEISRIQGEAESLGELSADSVAELERVSGDFLRRIVRAPDGYDFAPEGAIDHMPGRIAEDFFTLLMRTLPKRPASGQASSLATAAA